MLKGRYVFGIYNKVPYVHIGYLTVPRSDEDLQAVNYIQSVADKSNLSLQFDLNPKRRLPIVAYNSSAELRAGLGAYKAKPAYGLRSLLYCQENNIIGKKKQAILTNHLPKAKLTLY